MKISAVVLTRNEEENIERCLTSLKFCDEIIVVDDNSTDKTVDLVKKYGGRVYIRSLNGDFASQKNFALTKAQGDWILFIDADEVISPELQSEIELRLPAGKVGIKNNELCVQAFAMPRRDFIWGREIKHGEAGDIKLIRLAKKEAGHWLRQVHEVWQIEDGQVDQLQNFLRHYPHRNISDFIRHINQWSSLHARANFDEGKRSDLLKICLWPFGKFIYNYFIKLGFLDRMPGFVMALMMSAHSFLAWSKSWIIQRKIQK